MSDQTPAIARLLIAGAAIGSLIGVPTAYSMLAAHAPQDTTAAAATSVVGEIRDMPIVESEDGSVERGPDGLFYARATVDGAPMRCLVDSGATGLVIDARRALRSGVIDHAPRFDGRLVTAGGSRPAARHSVARLELAGHDLRHVPAILVKDGGVPCLLGQDVLARLDAVEIRGDEIALR